MIPFATEVEAAVAALTEARACSVHVSHMPRECGGFIYEIAGKYYYTAPITEGSPNSVPLDTVYRLNWHWTADYHTHPCVGMKPVNEYFSMQDILSNDGLHLTGYMLNLCTGDIRRWAAGDDKDDIEVDLRGGGVFYLTSGHLVGFVL